MCGEGVGVGSRGELNRSINSFFLGKLLDCQTVLLRKSYLAKLTYDTIPLTQGSVSPHVHAEIFSSLVEIPVRLPNYLHVFRYEINSSFPHPVENF